MIEDSKKKRKKSRMVEKLVKKFYIDILYKKLKIALISCKILQNTKNCCTLLC